MVNFKYPPAIGVALNGLEKSRWDTFELERVENAKKITGF